MSCNKRHRSNTSACSNSIWLPYYTINQVSRVRSPSLVDAMAAFLLFVCVIFTLRGASVSVTSMQAHTNLTNLTFMMIASYGQYGFNSSGALPAVDMALEAINNDPYTLSGYNLMYDKIRDSMVSKLASLGKIITGIHKVATVPWQQECDVAFL